jgi:hypothetical protein
MSVGEKAMRWRAKMLAGALWTALFIVLVGNVGCCGGVPTALLRCNLSAHSDPSVANVTQKPTSVEYFDSVNVTAVLANATDVSSVVLFYQVGAADWEDAEMSNGSAQAFWGVIPPQGWGTHVQYYVNITDLTGHSVIEDNQSSYYRYVVVDTVEPVIRIWRPFSGEHVTGAIALDLEFEDAGSDIDYFNIYLDDVLVMGPGHANGIIGGVDASEGSHVIRVEVSDRAGNLAEEYRFVTVENTTTAIPGFPMNAIAIALVAGLAVGLASHRRRFRTAVGSE